MKTKSYTIYEFKELSEEMQQKVIEEYRYINVDFGGWSNRTIDYWKEKLETIGFEYPEIRFSGFGSQGDGASFEADVDEEKLLNNLIYCQQDYKNSKKFMLALQFVNKNMLAIELWRTNSQYVHKNSITTNVCLVNNSCSMKYWKYWQIFEDFIYDLIENLRLNLCQKIYHDLEQDYEYLTSEEAIIETFEANEYNFNEKGKIDN